MTIPRFLRGAALLVVMASVTASQSLGPGDAWQLLIQGPLSAPDGEEYFASTLKDRVVPRGLVAPYFQGVLVSITPETIGVRRLMLAMGGTDKADVTILLRGQMAKLKSEPKKGAVVHFNGVVQKFTKEPFMVTFQVNRLGSFVDFVKSGGRNSK